MQIEIIPTGIKVDRKKRILSINWKDGHISEYPFWLLRAACPCAECRGGHDEMSNHPPQDVFNSEPEDSLQTKIEKVEQVGSYALEFGWGDEHSAGIYNWRYLRLLCPCAECRKE